MDGLCCVSGVLSTLIALPALIADGSVMCVLRGSVCSSSGEEVCRLGRIVWWMLLLFAVLAWCCLVVLRCVCAAGSASRSQLTALARTHDDDETSR